MIKVTHCLFLFFLLTTITKKLLGSKLNLKTRLTRYNKIEENMQTAHSKTYRVIGQNEWSKTACSHSAAATTLRISTKKTMHTASIEKLLISTADTHQFNCNIIIGSQLQQKSRGLR